MSMNGEQFQKKIIGVLATLSVSRSGGYSSSGVDCIIVLIETKDAKMFNDKNMARDFEKLWHTSPHYNIFITCTLNLPTLCEFESVILDDLTHVLSCSVLALMFWIKNLIN